jgi:hypothetical protein
LISNFFEDTREDWTLPLTVLGLEGVGIQQTPAACQDLNSGVAFVPLDQPTTHPTIVARATAADISETARQHEVGQKACRLMHLVQATSRKMLLNSSDEIHRRQEIILCSGRTVIELINHMTTTCGSFTDAERLGVTSRLAIPWEGGPLKGAIQQIQEASDACGLGGAALTDIQKRNELYDLVNASNLIADACQRWRVCPAADKTWPNTCAHFQDFDNDRNDAQTAGNSGFHANQIELTLAANAETPGTWHDQMANLGENNDTQAATVLDLTTHLAAATAACQAHSDITGNGNNQGSNNNRRNNGTNRNPRHNGTQCEPQPRRCCWSHGCCAHLSATCSNPRSGHQNAATLSNRMGGSSSGCPK